MTAMCGMISWACICFTYIRFRRGTKAQGIDRGSFAFRGAAQPYLSYCESVHSPLLQLR